jgi:hypothetical protein
MYYRGWCFDRILPLHRTSWDLYYIDQRRFLRGYSTPGNGSGNLPCLEEERVTGEISINGTIGWDCFSVLQLGYLRSNVGLDWTKCWGCVQITVASVSWLRGGWFCRSTVRGSNFGLSSLDTLIESSAPHLNSCHITLLFINFCVFSMPRDATKALEDVWWLGYISYQPLSNLSWDGRRTLSSQITRRLKETFQSWWYQYMSRDRHFPPNAPRLAEEYNSRYIERFLGGWRRHRRCATSKNLQLVLFECYESGLKLIQAKETSRNSRRPLCVRERLLYRLFKVTIVYRAPDLYRSIHDLLFNVHEAKRSSRRFIRQKHTWAPLQLSEFALRKILTALEVNPVFLDILHTFGNPKQGHQSRGLGGYGVDIKYPAAGVSRCKWISGNTWSQRPRKTSTYTEQNSSTNYIICRRRVEKAGRGQSVWWAYITNTTGRASHQFGSSSSQRSLPANCPELLLLMRSEVSSLRIGFSFDQLRTHGENTWNIWRLKSRLMYFSPTWLQVLCCLWLIAATESSGSTRCINGALQRGP